MGQILGLALLFVAYVSFTTLQRRWYSYASFTDEEMEM